MTSPADSLIAELDALFGKASPRAKPKPNGKAKPGTPAHKPEQPERYWLPEAVVLYTSSWRCTCGNSGSCAPILGVRERQGRAVRVRSIPRPGMYAQLPREIQQAEPSMLNTCPDCFAASPFGTGQLDLPLGEADVAQLARFIESGFRAAQFADALTDPWNTSRLTPEAREARLALILNLKESFNHDET
jgi:hypothetical protein